MESSDFAEESSDFAPLYDKSIQSCIDNAVRRRRFEEHMSLLVNQTDTNNLAWFVSCRETYPGRWSEMSPKAMHSTISPREFECQLFYR